jgi:predicted short-subunit dehydrogenase-like oxidoreductase (DUF2520 family)
MTGVAIIGAGRLGTSLGRALAEKGCPILWITDRKPAAARESRRIIGQGRATSDTARAAEAGIIVIAVPDEEIERTARALSKAAAAWPGKVVLHTSGILSSAALAGLRSKGAACASFHPVQSFPRKDMPAAHFKNIVIALEGDAAALSPGKRLIHLLGARPYFLRARDKAFFHAACSMASNLFVPLFEMARTLLGGIGIKGAEATKILLPLVAGTLQSVKHFDGADALTGPISRGDVETVKKHLEALKRYPSARRAYQVLGAEALRLARKKGLPSGKFKALKEMMPGG